MGAVSSAATNIEACPVPGLACLCSGAVVVDLDKYKDGYETLDEWVAQCAGEELLDTVIAQTGGGGQHYFFSARDANSFRSVTSWRQGIEIKAVGVESS